MLASLLIIAVSLVLLVYWFRYTCLLLLDQNRLSDQAPEAIASGLSHLQIKTAEPEPLQQALDRDYKVLCYVLRHAAGVSLNPAERHMLTADYRLMRLWYVLTRTVSPAQAGKALAEMSSILCFLDRRIGNQTAQRA